MERFLKRDQLGMNGAGPYSYINCMCSVPFKSDYCGLLEIQQDVLSLLDFVLEMKGYLSYIPTMWIDLLTQSSREDFN
jgi:hypothetical protein